MRPFCTSLIDFGAWLWNRSTIGFGASGDTAKNHARDLLGQVYEYFLGQFASAEGKRGGQFYTPASIVKTLVAVLAPHHGKVYDPCCGSGGMFVQSERFIEAHGGKIGDVSVYGQEANPTAWRLAAMNLAIRGIDFNLGKEPADTFVRNQHSGLRTDSVLAPIRPLIFPIGGMAAWKATRAGSTARRREATPTTHGCSTCCST
jgi:type I restriction enzyme M protein